MGWWGMLSCVSWMSSVGLFCLQPENQFIPGLAYSTVEDVYAE